MHHAKPTKRLATWSIIRSCGSCGRTRGVMSKEAMRRCTAQMNSLLPLFLRALGWWCGVQGGEVLQQKAVHEDVAAADFAQEDVLGSVVEEARVVPGHCPSPPEEQAQEEVFDICSSTV